MKQKNKNLHKAKKAKKDEFYTQLHDIENETKHYKDQFRGKTVYCNCDDPTISKFYHYFSYNFEFLGLKKLIATCYRNTDPDMFSKGISEKAVKLEYYGFRDGERVPNKADIVKTELEGDGDFRSDECIEILKEADIVVTNPPFSLFRDYVAQLVEHNKQFLIVGPMGAITYKGIFPLMRDNKLWLGCTAVKEFKKPCGEIQKFGNICWFTNMLHKSRNEPIKLFRRYYPKNYPVYENYDAIEVNRVADIPEDYYGYMGVPVSFMNKYCPEQFEIYGATESDGKGFSRKLWNPESGVTHAMVNGKKVFKRFFIKRKGVKQSNYPFTKTMTQ